MGGLFAGINPSTLPKNATFPLTLMKALPVVTFQTEKHYMWRFGEILGIAGALSNSIFLRAISLFVSFTYDRIAATVFLSDSPRRGVLR